MSAICVFASSAHEIDAQYGEAVGSLVDEFAKRDIGVVCGGFDVGMMGAVARQAVQHGLQVAGVIPVMFEGFGLSTVPGIEVIGAGSMAERLEHMIRRSSAFIALPGGYGTFEELFQILSMQQLGLLKKPLGLLNTCGYFDHLMEQLRRAQADGAIRPEHVDMIVVEQSPDALLEALTIAVVPAASKWSVRGR